MEEIISEIKELLDQLLEKGYVDKQKKYIVANRNTFEIKCNGKKIELTKSEFIILSELVKAIQINCDGICSLETICKSLYNCNLDRYLSLSIKTHVYRLRKKLKELIDIKTIKYKGYKIEEVSWYVE